MRLSEWRAASPSREAASQKISTLVDPILGALGAEADPGAWVVWGEEPATRYTILVPTPAGLVSCFVRVSVPGEGPRATAKLIRWNRLQLGELAVEAQGGHRLVTFQVEGNVLRGVDETADGVGRFAVELFAAVDGRPPPGEGLRPPGRAHVSAARRTRGKPAPGSKPAASGDKPATGARPASGDADRTARSGSGRTPAARPLQRG